MKAKFLRLVYAGAVLSVSLLAFGPWGIPAAVMVLLFWWLWRQREAVFLGLAVVALLALAASLFLGPLIPIAQEAAIRNQCVGHLKQLGLAIHNFHHVEGNLPPLRYDPTETGHDHSWRVAILPFMEYEDVYQDYHFEQSWDASLNRDKFHQPFHEMFSCQAIRKNGPGVYLAATGKETVWGEGEARSFADITDDPADTILCIETPRVYRAWNEPRDLTFDEAVELLSTPISDHKENAHFTRGAYFHRPQYQRNVVMCDGSCHVLNVPLDRAAAVAILTATGGEEVDVDAHCEPGPAQLDWSRISRFAAFVVVALLPIALIWRQRLAQPGAS